MVYGLNRFLSLFNWVHKKMTEQPERHALLEILEQRQMLSVSPLTVTAESDVFLSQEYVTDNEFMGQNEELVLSESLRAALSEESEQSVTLINATAVVTLKENIITILDGETEVFSKNKDEVSSLVINCASGLPSVVSINMLNAGESYVAQGIMIKGSDLEAGQNVVKIVGSSSDDMISLSSSDIKVNNQSVTMEHVDLLVLDGEEGNDTYQIAGLPVETKIYDISGINGLDFSTYVSVYTYGITVNLGITSAQKIFAQNDAPKLTLASLIHNVTGSPYGDTLTGNSLDNVIMGGSGNDVIYGGTGDDTLGGGLGEDIIYGDSGNDLIYGNSAAEMDSGHKTIYGGAGNDMLFGSSGNDKINGGTGDDVLVGNAGNDILESVSGRNIFIGSDGTDELTAGTEESLLIGGRTEYDASYMALRAVYLEWASGRSRADRIANLEGGVHGEGDDSENIYKLDTSTVYGDTEANKLLSTNGENWLFISEKDVITGQKELDHVTTVTEQALLDVQQAAYEALNYGYTLVYESLLREMSTNYDRTLDTESYQENQEDYVMGYAPENQFIVSDSLLSADDITGTLSVDTLNLRAWLNIDIEPVIISIPEITEKTDGSVRYAQLELYDAWMSYVRDIKNTSSETLAGNYMLTHPDWTGVIPEGVQRVDVTSEQLYILLRIQTDLSDDMSDAQNVYTDALEYKIIPLSEWNNRDTYEGPTGTWSESIDMLTTPRQKIANMGASEFYSKLNELLEKNPAPASDADILSRLEVLGVGAGLTFGDGKDAEWWAEVSEGMERALSDLYAAVPEVETVSGWMSRVKEPGVYEDYVSRAEAAVNGDGYASPYESLFCAVAASDSAGNKLNGDNAYSITIQSEELPQVDGFWSVTLLDTDGYPFETGVFQVTRFPESASGMTLNEDGSLTLYIQTSSPGETHENNWLEPISGEDFILVFRCYSGDNRISTGMYHLPGVVKGDAVDPNAPVDPDDPDESEIPENYTVIFNAAETRLDQMLTSNAATAVSVAYAENDDINIMKTLTGGVSDPVSETELTDQVLFGVGNVSKLITAASIMKLVEEDQLQLDDSVMQLLESAVNGFSASDYPEGYSDITVSMLLDNTSGLGASTTLGEQTLSPNMDYAEIFLDSLKTQELIFTPGTSGAYSDAAFTLAAILVEKISGKSYKQYVTDSFLTPAGLTNIYFGTDWLGVGDYAQSDSMIESTDGTLYPQEFQNDYGADGIYATPSALAQFMGIFLGVTRDTEGERILSDSSCNLILSYTSVNWSTDTVNRAYQYGLGWDTVSDPLFNDLGVQVNAISSEGDLYATRLFLVPDYGIVISASGTRGTTVDDLDAILRPILVSVLKEKGAVSSMLDQFQPAEETEMPEELVEMSGVYGNGDQLLRVTVNLEGELTLEEYQNGEWGALDGIYTYREDDTFTLKSSGTYSTDKTGYSFMIEGERVYLVTYKTDPLYGVIREGISTHEKVSAGKNAISASWQDYMETSYWKWGDYYTTLFQEASYVTFTSLPEVPGVVLMCQDDSYYPLDASEDGVGLSCVHIPSSNSKITDVKLTLSTGNHTSFIYEGVEYLSESEELDLGTSSGEVVHQIAPEKGFTRVKINGTANKGYTLSLEVPENGRYAVYDENFNLVYDSFFNDATRPTESVKIVSAYSATVSVKTGYYVLLAAATDVSFTLKLT